MAEEETRRAEAPELFFAEEVGEDHALVLQLVRDVTDLKARPSVSTEAAAYAEAGALRQGDIRGIFKSIRTAVLITCITAPIGVVAGTEIGPALAKAIHGLL